MSGVIYKCVRWKSRLPNCFIKLLRAGKWTHQINFQAHIIIKHPSSIVQKSDRKCWKSTTVESSRLQKPFINSKTSHIKSNIDTLFDVAFHISSAFPIKFDYLQFDFSACSSLDDGERENPQKRFWGVKWFQSNSFCVSYAFTVFYRLMRSHFSIIVWLTSIFTWLRFAPNAVYGLLFHSGISTRSRERIWS